MAESTGLRSLRVGTAQSLGGFPLERGGVADGDGRRARRGGVVSGQCRGGADGWQASLASGLIGTVGYAVCVAGAIAAVCRTGSRDAGGGGVDLSDRGGPPGFA